jgi:O-antigen/teichoic acid export membrane protein
MISEPARPAPSSASTRTSRFFLTSGVVLTALVFISSCGNFLYQIVMCRLLPTVEVGLMNAALAILGLVIVPMVAASRALAHFVSRHDASGDQAALNQLLACCQRWLRQWTWRVLAAELLLLYPIMSWLGFERLSLMLVIGLCVPALLWSSVGEQWFNGLGRFYEVGLLTFLSMLVRVISGILLVWWMPQADGAVAASFFAALVMAAVILVGPHPDPGAQTGNVPNLELRSYLLASLAAGLGIFLFTMGDVLAAKRHLTDFGLGQYTKSGLLGRAVLWGAFPVLVVYFTQRSARDRSDASSWRLLGLYAGLVGVGCILLVALAGPLSAMLVPTAERAHLSDVTFLTRAFAMAMVPLAILQAVGMAALAGRRIRLCLTFGGLAMAYAATLLAFQAGPHLLLSLVTGGAWGIVLIFAMVALVQWSRSKR